MTMSSSTSRPRKTAAKKAPADRKLSLRDQLKSKKPHTTRSTFPVGDEGEKAKAALEEARGSLGLLRLLSAQEAAKPNGKTVDLTAAEAEVERAEAAYRDVSMTLVFRGLNPVEVDELASEFNQQDPKDGDKPEFDTRGYTCALMAATVVDSDLTAEEWDAELYKSGRWSDGEIHDMREKARAAYQEAPGPGIPKG